MLPAVEALPVNVLYYSTIKPFDAGLLKRYAHTRLVVVHDATGLFEEVCEHAAGPVTRIGLPDRFVSCYGTIQDVRREVELDAEHIRQVVTDVLHETPTQTDRAYPRLTVPRPTPPSRNRRDDRASRQPNEPRGATTRVPGESARPRRSLPDRRRA